MKKDKKWLKEALDKLTIGFNGRELSRYEVGRLDGYTHASMLFDELDEPEKALEQEAVDELIKKYSKDEMSTYDVKVERERFVKDLQNLLVPKKEEPTHVQVQKYLSEHGIEVVEKPVIPQFVANFIRATKPNNSLRLAFEYIAQQKIDNYDDGLAFWIEEGNSELFARAWLDGYEVEKEKKYYIYDKSTKGYLGYNADKTRLSWYTSQFPNDVFTEQEIKAIDERYWVFAEEVTE